MEPPDPVDLRSADWPLTVEALVALAGKPNELEGPREYRAYKLIEIIAAADGLPAGDFLAGLGTGWTKD